MRPSGGWAATSTICRRRAVTTGTATQCGISGASRILLPYLVHRAGYSNADTVEAAQQAVGTATNPVVDVDLTGDTLTVTYADGTNETFTIAAGGGTVDQTARDAAEAAQTTADTATAAAGDASAEAASAGTAAAAAEVVAGTAQTAAEDALTTATAAQRATANNATTITSIGNTQAQIAPLITENAAEIAAGVVAATNHAADPDAHHTPPSAVGGSSGYILVDTNVQSVNLTANYQQVSGMFIPAATFVAGEVWRVTAVSNIRGIGDNDNTGRIAVFQGANIEGFWVEIDQRSGVGGDA